MPRKRLLKRWAQNAKKNLTPYREARKGGSKRLVRRQRAFNRLSRQIARKERNRIASCRQTIIEIDAYQPENEKEKQGLVGLRGRLSASIERYEEKQAKDAEFKAAMDEIQAMTSIFQGCTTWAGVADNIKNNERVIPKRTTRIWPNGPQ